MSAPHPRFRLKINDVLYELGGPADLGWESLLDRVISAYYVDRGAPQGKWVRHVGEPERLGWQAGYEVFSVRTTRNDVVTIRVREVHYSNGMGGGRDAVRMEREARGRG